MIVAIIIYDQGRKHRFMVKSTIRKLNDYFQGMPSGKFYIGKVVYLSEKEIKEKYSGIQKNQT